LGKAFSFLRDRLLVNSSLSVGRVVVALAARLCYFAFELQLGELPKYKSRLIYYEGARRFLLSLRSILHLTTDAVA
jgi:hypothetical protein